STRTTCVPFPGSCPAARWSGRSLRSCCAADQSPLHLRREVSSELAPPPRSTGAPLRAGGEPILPEHRAHGPGRRARERIAAEEGQHVRALLGEAHLGVDHPGVLLPG